jgi:translation initiation factor IF-3
MNNIKESIINEQIPDKNVMVIDESGNKIGVLARDGAIRIAQNKGMDLVLVSDISASPLVAKIMDNAKYRYDQKRKAKEARKNQKTITVKEIQLSPVIQEHDIQTKERHARKFLEKGNYVKITMRLKGRMVTRADQGKEIIINFIERLSEISEIKGKIKLDERNLETLLIPIKEKR